MHDVYMILSEYLYSLAPDLVLSDRLEDINTGRNMIALTHQFIPDNKYTEARVFINQDRDNKELAAFLMCAEVTRSRLAPRPQIVQSRYENGEEVQYLSTYIVNFEVLSDEVVSLEQEDGAYVTPHALIININITKLKEEQHG